MKKDILKTYKLTKCSNCGRKENILFPIDTYNLCAYCEREMFPIDDIRE